MNDEKRSAFTKWAADHNSICENGSCCDPDTLDHSEACLEAAFDAGRAESDARIDQMHAERMAFAEQMNAELDTLRDAIAEQAGGDWLCTVPHPTLDTVKCRLAAEHEHKHSNGSFEW